MRLVKGKKQSLLGEIFESLQPLSFRRKGEIECKRSSNETNFLFSTKFCLMQKQISIWSLSSFFMFYEKSFFSRLLFVCNNRHQIKLEQRWVFRLIEKLFKERKDYANLVRPNKAHYCFSKWKKTPLFYRYIINRRVTTMFRSKSLKKFLHQNLKIEKTKNVTYQLV